MAIKGEPLTINMYAFDVSNNLPASGLTDISGYVIKDGSAPTALTNAISEPSSSNLPGLYEVLLSSGEMEANFITVGGKSFSNPTGVVIYPLMIATERGYVDEMYGKLPTNYIMGSSGPSNYNDNIETIESNVIAISGYTDSLEAGQTSLPTWVWSHGLRKLTLQGETAIAAAVAASGNAEGWGDYPDIDTIIASGNANNWDGVSASNIADIVSGVWEHVIDGTADAETALKYALAYCAGNCSRTGGAYTYRDFDNTSDVMTLTGTDSSRTRS